MSVPNHSSLPPRPLSTARPGEVLRLHRLSGESDLQARLAALGFVPGVELRLVGNSTAGGLLISLKDCRLVLGSAMARHLWVQ